MHSLTLDSVFGPHAHARVLMRGNTKNPSSAVILLHGRGASAEHIFSILESLALPDWLLVMVPEANDKAWFPVRFYEPRVQNEPHLTSALSVVGELVDMAERSFGISTVEISLAGFSQGASLISEYLIERPAQFKGACIFSGGLPGSDTEIEVLEVNKSLLQTLVYMGCDVEDPHVPLSRFKKTKEKLEAAGALLTYREYKDLRHAIHAEGLQFLGQLIRMQHTK